MTGPTFQKTEYLQLTGQSQTLRLQHSKLNQASNAEQKTVSNIPPSHLIINIPQPLYACFLYSYLKTTKSAPEIDTSTVAFKLLASCKKKNWRIRIRSAWFLCFLHPFALVSHYFQFPQVIKDTSDHVRAKDSVCSTTWCLSLLPFHCKNKTSTCSTWIAYQNTVLLYKYNTLLWEQALTCDMARVVGQNGPAIQEEEWLNETVKVLCQVVRVDHTHLLAQLLLHGRAKVTSSCSTRLGGSEVRHSCRDQRQIDDRAVSSRCGEGCGAMPGRLANLKT